MHLRVRVKREPFVNEGKAIRKVECAKAGAGAIAGAFQRPGGGETEEALQEGVQGDGLNPLSSPNDGALEPEFEVGSGPKADLLDMDPGVVGIGVALKWAHQELITEGAGEPG